MFLCICLGVLISVVWAASIVLARCFTGAGEGAFNSEYQAYVS
jgi:hypothetical protein